MIEGSKLFEFLLDANPWWEEDVLIFDFKRWHFYDILRNIQEMRTAEAELMVGMRRTGKTTILLQLAKELHSSGYSVVYIPVDDLIIKEVGKLREVIDFYMKNFRESDKVVILLDEVQFYDSWSLEVKTLIDGFRRKNELVKVIATGSSSLGITIGAGESLIGRASIRYIHTFSPLEAFALMKNEKGLIEKFYKRSKTLIQMFLRGNYFNMTKELYTILGKKTISELQSTLKEFLIYGTLPEVLNLIKTGAKSYEVKRKLSEILDLTILRDVLRIQRLYPSKYELDASEAQLIIKTVMMDSPIQTSYTDISNKLNIIKEKVKLAVNLGKYAGLMGIAQPYSKNPFVKARKTRFKLFAMDNGLRNHLTSLNKPKILKDETLLGKLFENFMLSRLISTIRTLMGINSEIYYWRSKKGSKTFEVDAITRIMDKVTAFEFKLHGRKSKSLEELLNYDKDIKGYLLNFEEIEKLLPFLIF